VATWWRDKKIVGIVRRIGTIIFLHDVVFQGRRCEPVFLHLYLLLEYRKSKSISMRSFLCTILTIAKSGISLYEGWNFNSGNYLFTTDTK